MWCIAPEKNAEFVCAMENVLEVYKRPYDPKRPVVCMDEKPKQLIKETRQPIACRKGQPQRYDFEYERNGTANVFLFVEPLKGWRRVQATERRTRTDWAQQIKELIDIDYKRVDRITLVMDNLNTHRLSCLYEAFTPDEARRIIEKIEVVHTPKHGSWLNMAECELSVLEKQCLGERIGDEPTLRASVSAWNAERNNRSKKIDWQFETADARIKLRRLYPQTQME